MSKNYKLSVCIPTFNRSSLLEKCVRSVAEQLVANDLVELLVIDNASTDDTPMVCERLSREFAVFKYQRNSRNLGWHGNTARCINLANGEYIALLGDDDYYQPGLVSQLLMVLSKREYSLVNLNYSNMRRPKFEFALEKDMEFPNADDILQYPSVGHFSGFVYNAKLAKKALAQAIARYGEGEITDILYAEIAVRVTRTETLPSFFLGKRLLVAGQPPVRAYKWILGPYFKDYQCYAKWFSMGLITSDALEFRKRLLVDGLPRAIITSIFELEQNEVVSITAFYRQILSNYSKFWLVVYPLLAVSHLRSFRWFTMQVNKIWRKYSLLL